jgi:mono/diheme cytochrome c family protein
MKKLKKVLWISLGLLVLIQLVPYGRSHANPPVVKDVTWDSAQTKALVRRACYDCHSNETVWPWYSNVAPVSWLVQRDVDEGREHLNFSEWNREQRHAKDAAASIEEGEMPMAIYLPTHPEARLTDEETKALLAGIAKSLGPQNAARAKR